MSVFKWGRLYQLSVMHTVVPYVYEGINRCRSQFFLHLSSKQEEEWKQAVREDQAQSKLQNDEMEEDELLRPDRLTNPLLNHRLQDILDDEHSDISTRQLLLILIRVPGRDEDLVHRQELTQPLLRFRQAAHGLGEGTGGFKHLFRLAGKRHAGSVQVNIAQILQDRRRVADFPLRQVQLCGQLTPAHRL